MIGNLQLLRAFAASGVVIYHANAKIFGVHTEFCGVALFFTLSGYLMCKISNRNALDFARDRLCRIVPNYWMATIFLLTLFHMWTYWPTYHTVLSFFFIPHDSIAGVHPVLAVGWTLNLEMYFYLLFTLALMINHRFAGIIAGSVIMLIWYALPHLTDNKTLLYYYHNEQVPYFAIGIVIWYLSEGIRKLNLPIKLPKLTLPVCMIIYIVAILSEYNNMTAVTLLFLAAVLCSQYGADLQIKKILLLGNASYALYLLHTILIEYLRHKGIQSNGSFLYTSGVMIGSWLIALAWYMTIEKTLSHIFRRKKKSVSIPDRIITATG